MAIIKAYTDISQSKTLSKVLSLGSADMCYLKREINDTYIETPIIKPEGDVFKSLPCWSLTELLSVLPLPSLIQDKADDELFWKCSAYNEDGTLLCEIYDNNPVDACVEMIIKLHEINLL